MSDSFAWDSHWQDYGDPTEGNPANHYRDRLILQLLGPPEPGDRLVDIGAGQGELAIQLASRFPGLEVLGIEASAEGVRRAQAAVARAGVSARFVQRDLTEPAELPIEQRRRATLAVCTEVLEHVEHPEVLVRYARDYLAPGCRVVVTVPGGPRTAFDRYIGHHRHFTRRTLRAALEAGGLRTERVYAAGFPFFNLYKLTVMLRGKRLIDDLQHAADSGEPSFAAKLALRCFDRAFHYNLLTPPFGWQLVAVASVRPERTKVAAEAEGADPVDREGRGGPPGPGPRAGAFG